MWGVCRCPCHMIAVGSAIFQIFVIMLFAVCVPLVVLWVVSLVHNCCPFIVIIIISIILVGQVVNMIPFGSVIVDLFTVSDGAAAI